MYLAAISACHIVSEGVSQGPHALVIFFFLKGVILLWGYELGYKNSSVQYYRIDSVIPLFEIKNSLFKYYKEFEVLISYHYR